MIRKPVFCCIPDQLPWGRSLTASSFVGLSALLGLRRNRPQVCGDILQRQCRRPRTTERRPRSTTGSAECACSSRTTSVRDTASRFFTTGLVMTGRGTGRSRSIGRGSALGRGARTYLKADTKCGACYSSPSLFTRSRYLGSLRTPSRSSSHLMYGRPGSFLAYERSSHSNPL